MATLKTIRDRVKEYVIDLPVELTDSLLNSWVNKGLIAAADRHNFRFMEATKELITAEGVRKIGTYRRPWETGTADITDFKEKRSDPWLLEGDGGSKEIDWAASHQDMVRLFSETDANDKGRPQFVLETPTELHAYPFPDALSLWADGNYRVNVPYWKYPAKLVADLDTNWLTDNAEWALVFFAVAEGLVFNREEERSAVYTTKAAAELTAAIRVDKRSKIARRITLVPHRDVNATKHQRRL